MFLALKQAPDAALLWTQSSAHRTAPNQTRTVSCCGIIFSVIVIWEQITLLWIRRKDIIADKCLDILPMCDWHLLTTAPLSLTANMSRLLQKLAYIHIKVRLFPIRHFLQHVCGVCVWRERLHWWHQTALPPAAQTAMTRKARQRQRPPQRPSPRGLAKRPFGSPWTPKMRGQSSAGTNTHTRIICSFFVLIGTVCPPVAIALLSLSPPNFSRKILPPPSLFFF